MYFLIDFFTHMYSLNFVSQNTNSPAGFIYGLLEVYVEHHVTSHPYLGSNYSVFRILYSHENIN